MERGEERGQGTDARTAEQPGGHTRLEDLNL